MIRIQVPYDRKVELDICHWLENNYGGPVVVSMNIASGPTWRLYHATKRDQNDEPIYYVTVAEFKYKTDAAMFALRWT